LLRPRPRGGSSFDAFGAYADPGVAQFVTAVRTSAAAIGPHDVGTPRGPPAPGADGGL